MRKMPMVGIILLLPALMLFSLVGCKDSGKPSGATTTVQPVGTTTQQAAQKKDKLDAPTDAVVKGVVMFKGEPPAPVVDARIQKNDTDGPKCMAGKAESMKHVQEQTWIIGANKGVANVIVSFEPPAGKSFNLDDPKVKEPFKKPVEIDQPFCMYEPHVVAVYAKIQPVVFKNTAAVTHNVNIPAYDPPFAEVLPSGKTSKELFFPKSKEPIGVSCASHNWMSAKIVTFDQPYFAVTKDDGSFEIKNVPSGAELTVYLWHEATGKKAAPKFTAKAGDNELKLEIAPK